jgi:ribosome-binding ATPase YchF (GTP1/OBG family)
MYFLCLYTFSALVDGKKAHALEFAPLEKDLIKQLQLITMKKSLYVCNISEDDLPGGNKYSQLVDQHAISISSQALAICAKLESEASMLDPETRVTILDTYGLTQTGLQKIIRSSYELLDLITFYTVGPEETRAWTIKRGSVAGQAAGEIHSDMEKGFIKADVSSVCMITNTTTRPFLGKIF